MSDRPKSPRLFVTLFEFVSEFAKLSILPESKRRAETSVGRRDVPRDDFSHTAQNSREPNAVHATDATGGVILIDLD